MGEPSKVTRGLIQVWSVGVIGLIYLGFPGKSSYLLRNPRPPPPHPIIQYPSRKLPKTPKNFAPAARIWMYYR